MLKKTLCKLNALYEESKISIDKKGNIYILTGFRDSIKIDSITLHTSLLMDISNAKNPRGILCIKLDSNLNTLFVKKLFETSDLATYNAPKFDSKNNLYISINFNDTLLYNSDTFKTANNTDGMLFKMDENFTPLLHEQFGNYNDDGLGLFDFDENDNLFLTGGFNNTWTGYSPNYPFVLCNDTIYSDRNGMFIGKFDSNFNCIWHRDYQIIGDEGIISMKYWNGSLYATLMVFNGSAQIQFGGKFANFPIGSSGRLFVAKIDSSNGDAKWIRTVTSQSSINSLVGISLDAIDVYQDKVYVKGRINTNSLYTIKFEGAPNLLQSVWQSDYYLGCYDTSGNFMWNTISQSNGNETLVNIVSDSEGNILGTGTFDLKIKYPNDTLYIFGNDDGFAVKYDKNGNYKWSARTGGDYVEQTSSAIITPSGKLIVLGTTSSPTCAFGNTIETFPGDGNYLFLASIDSLQEPFSNQSTQIIKEDIEVFPNPASNTLNIKTNLTKYQLYCYNTLGELVLQANEKQKSISINPLPNGIYQIKIISDKQYLNKKLIIQH